MISHTPPYQHPEREPGSRAFGETIRGRRMQASCTLRLCAALMGMSMSDLSAVEQGVRGFTHDERDRFEAVMRSRTNNTAASEGAKA